MIGKPILGLLTSLIIFTSALTSHGADAVPKLLSQYLKLDETVKARVFAVVPPAELNLYSKRFNEAAQKDPEWFEKFSADSAGVLFPYHEKLGLTKEEYQKYRDAWKARKFETVQNIIIRLEKVDDQYMIRVSGKGAKISLLRFQPKDGLFRSPNGVMKRLKDIDAHEDSILGGWIGQEWRYLEETSLGISKENFALGKTKDGKHGMMIYRLQDVSSTGRTLYDHSVMIRFALPAKGK